jgi:ArsR family transcriptional regulator
VNDGKALPPLTISTDKDSRYHYIRKVEHSYKQVGMNGFEKEAKLYKALMHPTRLAILDILRSGEECVCHMETALGLRQANISQQLMLLREAGLIMDRRDGWNIFYQVVKPEIYQVIDAAALLVGDSQDEKLPAGARKRYATCECPKCNNDQKVESF